MPSARLLGGAEMALLHLMQEKDCVEIEWVVIFMEEGPMRAQFQALGITTYLIPAGRLRQTSQWIRCVRQAAALARKEKVDALVSWMGKAHLYGSIAAHLAGIPALWFQHGMPSAKSWMDRITTLLPARGIFTCSQTTAEAQRCLRPLRSVEVVHPGVDLHRFDPLLLPDMQAARRNIGIRTDRFLIGIVGRLQRWKGIHVLIEAMPEVARSYPEAQCVIVGGRHELETDYPLYLKERIQSLCLEESVLLAGAQENIPQWMQAMDVIVHASDKEPFGMVIIEAMALGKPVIATNSGGPTEIISDGVNGLLVPFNDPKALAQSVLRCLGNEDFAGEIGFAARQRASEFSTRHFAGKFVAALRQFLAAEERK